MQGLDRCPPQKILAADDLGTPPRDVAHDSGFGRPNDLLGGGIPCSSASPALRSPSSTLPRSSPPLSTHSTTNVPAARSDDVGGVLQKVPSSSTPSPMKMPADGAAPASPALSFGVAREAVLALQESITTLLGKRASDESTNGMGRGHKRPRPRSKVRYS